jgi:hypothetical protein
MLGLLSSCGLCSAPDEVLAKGVNKPIEQPGRSASCLPGQEPFTYHPSTDTRGGTFDLSGQGQIKVGLRSRVVWKIGGMQSVKIEPVVAGSRGQKPTRPLVICKGVA